VAQEAPHTNGSRPKSENGNGNGHRKVGGYRLLRELDTDSLGSVYEAEHPRLHRRVALRTIGTGVAREVSFSRRFLLELRSYTALEHEAIPKLYELAYDGDSPYLVTELVAGSAMSRSASSTCCARSRAPSTTRTHARPSTGTSSRPTSSWRTMAGHC